MLCFWPSGSPQPTATHDLHLFRHEHPAWSTSIAHHRKHYWARSNWAWCEHLAQSTGFVSRSEAWYSLFLHAQTIPFVGYLPYTRYVHKPCMLISCKWAREWWLLFQVIHCLLRLYRAPFLLQRLIVFKTAATTQGGKCFFLQLSTGLFGNSICYLTQQFWRKLSTGFPQRPFNSYCSRNVW